MIPAFDKRNSILWKPRARDWLLWLDSVASSRCWCSSPDWVPISCFHIHNVLSFIHCATWRNIVWGIVSVVKRTNTKHEGCSNETLSGIVLGEEVQAVKIVTGRWDECHIEVPAYGSRPQKLPGPWPEWLHHSDPAKHANGSHLNNPRKLHMTNIYVLVLQFIMISY
jgi:hypothetical protein